MTKARELLKQEQDVTLSSGVTVHIVPFPTDLMQDINAYALEQFPDPIPPKKVIQVVDGEELVDDLDNEEYKVAKNKVEAGRKTIIFEAFLEECVIFDLAPYEADIQRLIKKYKVKFSDEPTEPNAFEPTSKMALPTEPKAPTTVSSTPITAVTPVETAVKPCANEPEEVSTSLDLF